MNKIEMDWDFLPFCVVSFMVPISRTTFSFFDEKSSKHSDSIWPVLSAGCLASVLECHLLDSYWLSIIGSIGPWLELQFSWKCKAIPLHGPSMIKGHHNNEIGRNNLRKASLKNDKEWQLAIYKGAIISETSIVFMHCPTSQLLFSVVIFKP